MDLRRLVGLLVLPALVACNHQSLVTQPIDPCTSGMTSAATALQPVTTRAIRQLPLRVDAAPVSAAYTAPSAQQMLQAMGMDMTTVTASSYSGQADQAAVLTSLGAGLTPTQGNDFAFLSTGVVGANTPSSSVDPSNPGSISTQPGTDFSGQGCSSDGQGHDCAYLSVTFTVPANVHSVKFDFNFLSVEYPEFVGSQFNDEFWVKQDSQSYSYPNIVHDNNNNPISINSVFFNSPCTGYPGSGFDFGTDGSTPASSASVCDAGATGTLTTQTPVKPGETVTLTFYVEDRGDGIYDSAVMLDNIILSPDVVTNPNTGGQVDVTCIYPTTGPATGGTNVEIHGDGFTNVQSVFFGTSPAASYQVVNANLILAVTPPGITGAVDVKVTASPNGTAIAGTGQGAFTYQ